ncbi:MAG: hypothetical protein V3U27_10010 [Candidatus Tectomicrobia bacterium]
MTALTLRDIAEQLPPGRTRDRYEQMAREIGAGVMAVLVPGCDQALWLVESPSMIPPLLDLGIARWRIWTVGEVRELTTAFGHPIITLADAAEVLTA